MMLAPPTVAEASLPPPRVALTDVPAALRPIFSDSKFERLLHGGGLSIHTVGTRGRRGVDRAGRCVMLLG